MPNGDRYVLSLQDPNYTAKSYFVCHEILSGNLINHLILRKLHSIMLIPAVSLVMSWQALCLLLPTTVANLAITVMCHPWDLESPNLPSASDFLSSLYGKHGQLERLTLRMA